MLRKLLGKFLVIFYWITFFAFIIYGVIGGIKGGGAMAVTNLQEGARICIWVIGVAVIHWVWCYQEMSKGSKE